MTNKTIALLGAGLLFLGAFLPIVSVPIAGPITYVQNGRGDGVIVLLLAAVTVLLAGTGRTRHVLWTGIAALAMLAFTFIRFQMKLAEMRERLATELAGNPFRGLAEAAMGAIQLQWGWAVLAAGAAMVTWAGLLERSQAKAE